MKKADSFGIHWFRRDLRIEGNAALSANMRKNSGRVLGLFCFDSQFLARPDFSHNRFAFFLKTLQSLRKDLQNCGGDLLIVDEVPEKVFPELFSYWKAQGTNLPNVSYSRDYEPFAIQRDDKLGAIFKKNEVEFESFRDHLVIEPTELSKGKPGEYYQIYTPFAKKWFDIFHSAEFQERISAQAGSLSGSLKAKLSMSWKDVVEKPFPYVDKLDHFIHENAKHVTVQIPDAGRDAVKQSLSVFKRKLNLYKTNRDVPGTEGTSRFSVYFKNGSLTTAQAIYHLQLQKIGFKTENGPARFLKELVWREFYYHILYHRPDVEHTAFQEKYKKIDWSNNKKWFEKWCAGQTGFPIVDAGMRELNTTGWMHNRVRMIVSSFLIKDLLIDWRWGERYFMEKLIDGDLAPNNGGWQWAASTGCDALPYFRVFNPWLQSQKFDPHGEYIRKYVPELRNVSDKAIHREEEDRGAYGYPEPMVVHSQQKIKAISLYK